MHESAGAVATLLTVKFVNAAHIKLFDKLQTFSMLMKSADAIEEFCRTIDDTNDTHGRETIASVDALFMTSMLMTYGGVFTF